MKKAHNIVVRFFEVGVQEKTGHRHNDLLNEWTVRGSNPGPTD